MSTEFETTMTPEAMANPPRIRPGDWIRFYQNGAVIISVVEYVRRGEIDGRPQFCTAIGSVSQRGVLEVRRDPMFVTGQ